MLCNVDMYKSMHMYREQRVSLALFFVRGLMRASIVSQDIVLTIDIVNFV